MSAYTPRSLLRRWFAGLTEQTFMSAVGVGDPRLTEYLADLLCRFVHVDQVYRLRDAAGQRLEEIAEMLLAAEGMPPEGRTRREVYRHIGDFTLFWTGLFPEALERRRSGWCKDAFVDYTSQGKRSYLIASAYDDEPYQEQAPVLRRLSEEFELCAYGLTQLRKEFGHPGTDGERRMLIGE